MKPPETKEAHSTKKTRKQRHRGGFMFQKWNDEAKDYESLTSKTYDDTRSAQTAIRDQGQAGKYRVIQVAWEGELTVETTKTVKFLEKETPTE